MEPEETGPLYHYFTDNQTIVDTFFCLGNVYPYISSDFKTVLSMVTPKTYRFCNVPMMNLCFEQL